MSSLQKTYQELSTKSSEDKKALDLLKNEKEEYSKNLRDLVLAGNRLEENIKTLENEIEENSTSLTVLEKKKGGRLSQLIEMKNKLKRLEEELSKCNSVLKEKETAAIEICVDRVFTTNSPVEIQKLLESK